MHHGNARLLPADRAPNNSLKCQMNRSQIHLCYPSSSFLFVSFFSLVPFISYLILNYLFSLLHQFSLLFPSLFLPFLFLCCPMIFSFPISSFLYLFYPVLISFPLLSLHSLSSFPLLSSFYYFLSFPFLITFPFSISLLTIFAFSTLPFLFYTRLQASRSWLKWKWKKLDLRVMQ